ncbi:hypothetical protein C0581_02165 [Candidatus Parcubacteria bacterium]|nr:MAG: hypothetical protein C0581_02165 [Candidatus Parcubacteria bacterium]
MPKLIDDSVLIGDILHEWSVPEYDQHTRNRAWYILMTIIGVGFVVYALFTDNFLFALVIILFAIIVFLQTHQEPIVIPFKITELGIMVNNRFYSYSELDEFYIIYNPPEVKTLFIETVSTTKPRLRIPFMDEDPNEVRATLKEFLDEDFEKEEEPFSDMLARKWQLH